MLAVIVAAWLALGPLRGDEQETSPGGDGAVASAVPADAAGAPPPTVAIEDVVDTADVTPDTMDTPDLQTPAADAAANRVWALQTSPKGAVVSLGGKPLGATPLEIVWPAAADPPVVTIGKKGYETVVLKLPTNSSPVPVIELARRASTSPGPKRKRRPVVIK